MERKTLEVVTIPQHELIKYLFLEGFDVPPILDELKVGDIKEVKLTDNGIRFAICFTHPWSNWKKYKEGKPGESIAKLEKTIGDIYARARRGEITVDEAIDLAQQEIYDRGIKVFTVDEDLVFRLIHDKRFPSFWGSFFKPDAWVGPGIGQQITKVELTNDGIEFTMAHVRVP